MLRELLSRLVPAWSTDKASAPAAEARADQLIDCGSRAEREGNLGAACKHYRSAVEGAPGYAKAHLNLGTALEALGDLDGALASYERAHTLDPGDVYAAYNLGRLLYLRGILSRAKGMFGAALACKPDFPEALVALAAVHEVEGDCESAASTLEAALERRPDWAGGLHNYARILVKLARLDEAEAAFRRVMALDPANAEAAYDLATVHYSRGALSEAARLLLAAVASRPDFPEAHLALSNVHDSSGNLEAAAASVKVAIEKRPNWPEGLNNYGMILQKLQKLEEAEAVVRRAIAVAPDFLPAYQTLGAILVNQGRVPEALQIFRSGGEFDASGFDLESACLFALNLSDEISTEELFARHTAFGRRLERTHRARFEPFRNTRDAARRLRVGYLSGDFCSHPVALFSLPVFERHDRSAFEIYAYSVGTVLDSFTELLQSRSDVWRLASAMSHAALADKIHEDGIDILIDLSGHSGQSRQAVFAQQPAPVQASWLGYLSTTGNTRIHYRICDQHTDPASAEQFHTESLIRLPHSQWCYRPRPWIDYTSGPPPLQTNGFVTFGSFNSIPKISQTTRKMWADLLTRLPESRLVVVGVPDGYARDSLHRYFKDRGVAAERVILVPRVTIQEYFRWFKEVDLALDTTPYSGGTTTCDSLWMGVPVITIPGSRPVSRSAAGILAVAGLTEWIAATPDEYVDRAITFGQDGRRMSTLRATLRNKLQASPIMDEIAFVRDLEDAYRAMWRSWCADGALRA